ncbi:hypothetical protein BU14_0108s0024 [Porphyra umbilicalis]|uniref:Uncharacterized protein n=1 Tax=Porphyra umbilicalis TaxID=2786 RepID=A0A1X6PCL6_PORUM|nr:hypothetical protein BU14_0108s0024 [Porphyra umbilicalis]|eukprot:OSX78476.1 hypothetical protein BU14_0108s0024 [Porphyra umbilicalis]
MPPKKRKTFHTPKWVEWLRDAGDASNAVQRRAHVFAEAGAFPDRDRERRSLLLVAKRLYGRDVATACLAPTASASTLRAIQLEQAASSGAAPMPVTAASSGAAPLPPTAASSGAAPLPPTAASSGGAPLPPTAAPLPPKAASSGGAPLPPKAASSGGAPLPPKAASSGGAPLPPTAASSGAAPLPPTAASSGAAPLPPTAASSGGAGVGLFLAAAASAGGGEAAGGAPDGGAAHYYALSQAAPAGVGSVYPGMASLAPHLGAPGHGRAGGAGGGGSGGSGGGGPPGLGPPVGGGAAPPVWGGAGAHGAHAHHGAPPQVPLGALGGGWRDDGGAAGAGAGGHPPLDGADGNLSSYAQLAALESRYATQAVLIEQQRRVKALEAALIASQREVARLKAAHRDCGERESSSCGGGGGGAGGGSGVAASAAGGAAAAAAAVGGGGGADETKKCTSRYWTAEEHGRFLEGLEIFGAKDIKAISRHVGTRTPIQVRTHAQKHNLRLQPEQQRLQQQKADSEGGGGGGSGSAPTRVGWGRAGGGGVRGVGGTCIVAHRFGGDGGAAGTAASVGNWGFGRRPGLGRSAGLDKTRTFGIEFKGGPCDAADVVDVVGPGERLIGAHVALALPGDPCRRGWPRRGRGGRVVDGDGADQGGRVIDGDGADQDGRVVDGDGAGQMAVPSMAAVRARTDACGGNAAAA